MEIALLLGGVAISLLVEFAKNKWSLTRSGVMMLVVAISLIGGLAYHLLVSFGYWEVVLKVLVSAGAFYAFVIKNVKDVAEEKVKEEIEEEKEAV